MLRITVITESKKTVLKVEGKLIGPWVRELERCWGLATDRNHQEPIQVDLTDVAFVDSVGKELIGKMCCKGADLLVAGPLMTSIVNEMHTEALQSQRNCIREVS